MTGRGIIDRRWASDGERRQAFIAAAVLLVLVAFGLVALRPTGSHRAARTPATTAAAPTAATQSTTTPPLAPTPSAPSNASPSPAPTPAPKPSRAQVNRTQDAQNRDPRFRARLRRDLRERPAFQHLPYHADGVGIELAGTTRDGRLVLSVTYRGRLADARRVYRRFLARYHDPGRAYQPTYQPQR